MDRRMVAEICPWESTQLVAAAYGDIVKLSEELNQGADVHQLDHEYKRSPLSWAADGGHRDAVQLLLEHGADVNFTEPYHGKTPLFSAVVNGNETVASALIEAGASLDVRDTCCETPLIVAATAGRISMVKLLLNAGADIDAVGGLGDRTALSLAAAHGHLGIVKLLLQHNALTNLADSTGRKPMAWANEESHEEVVSVLARQEKNADPTYANVSRSAAGSKVPITIGFPASSAIDGADEVCDEDRLEWAFKMGYTDAVKQILGLGVNEKHTTKTGQTFLMLAAKMGYFDIVEFLLEKNVEVNQKDAQERTVLSYAVEMGHAKIVALLIERGSDIHSEDDQKMTPLTVASLRGHEDIVSILLERGADPNHRDDEGFSPMLHAALDGHAAVVSILIEKGMNPNHRDKEDGLTVLTWAARHGHLDIVSLLLSRGMSPNDEETDQTPLARALDNAIDTSDYSVVKLLLQHGAQPFLEVYWDNVSPLEIAVSNGLAELVILFLAVKPASDKVKQDHVRKAICEAVDWGREDLLGMLFQHYAPVELNIESPLDWARDKCCGSESAVRLLSPYFSNEVDGLDGASQVAAEVQQDSVIDIDENPVESLAEHLESTQMV